MSTKSTKSAKEVWFARGGGIARCGPYATFYAARDAMRLAKYQARTQIAGNFKKGRADVYLVETPAQAKDYPDDLYIWPEDLDEQEGLRG